MSLADNKINIIDLIKQRAYSYKDKKALSIKEQGSWSELSYKELYEKSTNLANNLIKLGIKKQDKIAILSESRPEWGVALFASVMSGATVVPLDIKLTLSELKSILSDCKPKIILISSQFADIALDLKKQLDFLENIFVINSSQVSVLSSINNLEKIENNIKVKRTLEELAFIIYTSGTTGSPKGVMITFKNLLSQIQDFEKLFNIKSSNNFLSILPLNHLFELNVGFLFPLYCGSSITFVKSLTPREISQTMQERKITNVISVPLFLKMIKNGIESEIRKQTKLKQLIFKIFFMISSVIPFSALKKILFFSIHKKLGGNLDSFICGAAPLTNEIISFFINIGINVYQGYGLTETSPCISSNTPRHNKIGSVGKPFESIKLKIDKNSEILVKGPNVMQGYYNSYELTQSAFNKEGWFHTGDIGKLDKEGYLYITGRIKNLIVLGGGKKVHPEEVESVLLTSDMFKEVCVIGTKIESGKNKGYEKVSAIITPSDALAEKFNNNKTVIKDIIENEIKLLCTKIAPYKHPKEIIVYYKELPKTLTKKIKREEVKNLVIAHK